MAEIPVGLKILAEVLPVHRRPGPGVDFPWRNPANPGFLRPWIH